MYRTEVKLDSLSNTDRTGTKNQDFLSSFCLFSLIEASKAGVIIWCLCSKLSCTGINHFVCSADAIVITLLLDLFLRNTGKTGNYIIRELNAFCFCKELCSKLFLSFAYCL